MNETTVAQEDKDLDVSKNKTATSIDVPKAIERNTTEVEIKPQPTVPVKDEPIMVANRTVVETEVVKEVKKQPEMQPLLVTEPIQTNVTATEKVFDEPKDIPMTNTTQVETQTESKKSQPSSKEAETSIKSDPE